MCKLFYASTIISYLCRLMVNYKTIINLNTNISTPYKIKSSTKDVESNLEKGSSKIIPTSTASMSLWPLSIVEHLKSFSQKSTEKRFHAA